MSDAELAEFMELFHEVAPDATAEELRLLQIACKAEAGRSLDAGDAAGAMRGIAAAQTVKRVTGT